MPERVPCPKCSSLSTSLVNKPLFWGKFPDGVEFSCSMCGIILYGQKALDMVEEWRVNSRDALMATLKKKESERIQGARNRESELRREIADLRGGGFRKEPPSLPEVQRSLPEVQESLPEVQEILPEVQGSLPEVAESLPEVQGSLPEVQGSLPEVMFPPREEVTLDDREAKRKQRRKEEGARYRAKKRQAKQLEKEMLEKASPPKAPKKCAWEGCSNPSREKSKYCSKKCSNKFAHAAEALRKKTAKRS